MLHYTMTLYGAGGMLDSCTATVAADDMDGLRLRLIRWLEEERIILCSGDRIKIESAERHA